MLRSKIFHLKKIYKFGLDHFFEKRTIFILIKKTLLKIKSCSYRPNNARYEKMLSSKIVHLKEIYNFDFDHFLIKRMVFVLIVRAFVSSIAGEISPLSDTRCTCSVVHARKCVSISSSQT